MKNKKFGEDDLARKMTTEELAEKAGVPIGAAIFPKGQIIAIKNLDGEIESDKIEADQLVSDI